MKWVFFILVSLNLIVFGGMLAKNMSGMGSAQTVVIQQPVASPPVANVVNTPPSQENMQQVGENKADEFATESQRKKEQSQSSAKKKQEQRLRAEREKKKKQEQRRLAEQKKQSSTYSPKMCGGATVTLPEDVYHRIKGLFRPWTNAATRSVVRNSKSSNSMRTKEYWVVLSGGNEKMIQLIAKGFRPSPYGGLTVLGRFPDRSKANALRTRAMHAGFSASVMEKIINNKQKQTLSVAVYHVLFMNVNNNDIRELSKILKPYARLKRTSCRKK